MPVTIYEYDYETAYTNQTWNGNDETQLKREIAVIITVTKAIVMHLKVINIW